MLSFINNKEIFTDKVIANIITAYVLMSVFDDVLIPTFEMLFAPYVENLCFSVYSYSNNKQVVCEIAVHRLLFKILLWVFIIFIFRKKNVDHCK
jgi:hypothetical protein